jgi:hypothetical protein
MKLFDAINMMFSKTKDFRDQTVFEKSKNYFMINRFMAIKYPAQAMELSSLNINGGHVIDIWAALIGSQYSRTPNWMYAKTKKGKADPKSKFNPSVELIQKYCEIHQCSQRDFDTAHKFLGKSFEDEVKEFEALL